MKGYEERFLGRIFRIPREESRLAFATSRWDARLPGEMWRAGDAGLAVEAWWGIWEASGDKAKLACAAWRGEAKLEGDAAWGEPVREEGGVRLDREQEGLKPA